MKFRDHFSEDYFDKLKASSSSLPVNSNTFDDLKEFPLMKGKQCLYVADWRSSLISFSRGVKEMLGYTKNEFDINLLTNFFHPDDKAIVERIISVGVKHLVSNKNGSLDTYHLMTYRLKKKMVII